MRRGPNLGNRIAGTMTRHCAGWPEGYGRRVLAEIDSANAEAARIAGGLSGPEWILALRQSAARGRRGRPWIHAEGAFAATLAIPTAESPRTLGLRSFVASLALHDVLAGIAGGAATVEVKWPNDVLLNGGKVAGILLESASGPDAHLAIGFGVNLSQAPEAGQVEPGAVRPVCVLSQTGADLSPEAFLDLLAPAYARREAQFAAAGFAAIRADWLERAARIGETVRARTPLEEFAGAFETVDEAGCIVLSSGRKRVAIPAAEIFFTQGEGGHAPRD